MKIFYREEQAGHRPEFFLINGKVVPSPDSPERANRLLQALIPTGIRVAEPQSHGHGPRVAVHSPQYLDFLEHAYDDWCAATGSDTELIVSSRPVERPATYPRHIMGRAGWHASDLACPIGRETWLAACASSDTAASAAQSILDGERESYALCRPPGHHAYANRMGGFCFLNNTAIAAQHLRKRHDRVAVLDIDVHHGNGTQGIFYQRRDVFTVSIHADPAEYYPFFWGYSHELGEGVGEGYNLNLPVPVRSGDEIWLAVLENALAAIELFEPGALVLALGLDAGVNDPLKGGAVTFEGFQKMGDEISKLQCPVAVVQEGGYLCDDLDRNLMSFLSGFLSNRR